MGEDFESECKRKVRIPGARGRIPRAAGIEEAKRKIDMGNKLIAVIKYVHERRERHARLRDDDADHRVAR